MGFETESLRLLTMRGKTAKILSLVGLVLLLFVGYCVWFWYPLLRDPEIVTFMSLPFDAHLRQFQFCKYSLPSTYEHITYYYTHFDNPSRTLEHFLLFKNQETGQSLVLSALKEHPGVNFSEVAIGATELKDAHRMGGSEVRRVYLKENEPSVHMELLHFIPMFYTKKDITKGQDLFLKGIEVTSRKEFETEKTKALYFNGKFTRIGFFKKSSRWLFQYPATGFDFLKPMQGALAIINDKATGKTIFAVGAQETGRPFREEEFLYVVNSLTFDAEPVKEFVDRLRDRGIEAYNKPGKLKIEFGK